MGEVGGGTFSSLFGAGSRRAGWESAPGQELTSVSPFPTSRHVRSSAEMGEKKVCFEGVLVGTTGCGL